MTTGEMLIWTNRLKEVLNIKDSYIQRQRMRNLMSDFLSAYRENLNDSCDRAVWKMYLTLDQEHFAIV